MADEDFLKAFVAGMGGPKRRRKKEVIPRRKPSVVIPPREIVYISADKTICKTCPCFPPMEPYEKNKKLTPCLKNPLTLYELAEAVVNVSKLPIPFSWDELQVADWMEFNVGLPEYNSCILDNKIDGKELLLLEDPSRLAMINIHKFEDIQAITRDIRDRFDTECSKFSKSIGLPPNKLSTHCNYFKSRTGPTWGIRQNWKRYSKPDFPKTLFARVPIKPRIIDPIPHYAPGKHEPCMEYLVSRKFRLKEGIPKNKQFIWMEHRPDSPQNQRVEMKNLTMKKPKKPTIPKASRLDPPKIDTTDLHGNKLLLAKRRMPRPKFRNWESKR